MIEAGSGGPASFEYSRLRVRVDPPKGFGWTVPLWNGRGQEKNAEPRGWISSMDEERTIIGQRPSQHLADDVAETTEVGDVELGVASPAHFKAVDEEFK